MAAVEFALVLPVFLLVVFGITQFGWFFFQVQNGAFAAREGARFAAVGTKTTSEITDHVRGRIVGAASTPSVSVCYSDTDVSGDLNVGDQITVDVSFQAANLGFGFVPLPNGGLVTQTLETRAEDVKELFSDYSACSP